MELFAVSVTTLLLVAGFGANDAVRPPGRLGTSSVTFPVNPVKGVIAIASVTEDPWDRVKEGDEAPRAKLGGGLTVTQIVPYWDWVSEVPTIDR